MYSFAREESERLQRERDERTGKQSWAVFGPLILVLAFFYMLKGDDPSPLAPFERVPCVDSGKNLTYAASRYTRRSSDDNSTSYPGSILVWAAPSRTATRKRVFYNMPTVEEDEEEEVTVEAEQTTRCVYRSNPTLLVETDKGFVVFQPYNSKTDFNLTISSGIYIPAKIIRVECVSVEILTWSIHDPDQFLPPCLHDVDSYFYNIPLPHNNFLDQVDNIFAGSNGTAGPSSSFYSMDSGISMNGLLFNSFLQREEEYEYEGDWYDEWLNSTNLNRSDFNNTDNPPLLPLRIRVSKYGTPQFVLRGDPEWNSMFFSETSSLPACPKVLKEGEMCDFEW